MIILYTGCIFLSAFLLFLVQPMIGKMFLPWVGGSSAAWNTCMFFFQGLLMAGYAYTHLTIARLGSKKQVFLQFGLMTAAIFFLPMTFAGSVSVPEDPSLWLVWQLLKTCGLPFFMIAGISPLLQIWFAQTMHKNAQNPFFLYSASNAGSLAALLAYPTLVEPSLNLGEQARLWTSGYVVLLFLMLACYMCVKKSENQDKVIAEEVIEPAPSRNQILRWVVAAFVPSSLLLAVTQYMTTDLVPLPLFWVVPLMIYLFTYTVAFSDRFSPKASTLGRVALFTILTFISFYLFVEITYFWLSLVIHLFTFMIMSLFCHRTIAETKPGVKYLTGFYLWISFGGLLGGLFNSLLAPVIFSEYFEYPLLIALSCLLLDWLCLPRSDESSLPPLGGLVMAMVGVYVFCAIVFAANINLPSVVFGFVTYIGLDTTSAGLKNVIVFLADYTKWIRQFFFVLATLLPAILLRKSYRVRFFPLVSVVLLLLFVWNVTQHKIVWRSRNFFGVKKVFFDTERNLRYLAHGSTIHGKQSFAEDHRREPLTYYHRRGPLGDIFSLPFSAKKDLSVAIIGLGIGSTAAYSREGDRFVFFEIDPQVALIAAKKEIFSYLHDFAQQCTVIIGDGRLKMMQTPDNDFDIILIDAFSSDAVPIHLLTVEAMQIYLQKLVENGILAVHVSNRYLNLKPNLQALAQHYGLQLAFISDNNFDDTDSANFERSQAEYALFTRSKEIVNYLAAISDGAWGPLPAREPFKPWTDSHSSVYPLLRVLPDK